MKQIKKNSRRRSISTDDLLIKRKNQCLQQLLPENMGSGHSNFFKLGPDLNYIETQYRPIDDLSLLSQIDNEEPRLIVTLGIKVVHDLSLKKEMKSFLMKATPQLQVLTPAWVSVNTKQIKNCCNCGFHFQKSVWNTISVKNNPSSFSKTMVSRI